MALVVRIELWPLGDESRKKTLGAMVIGNDGTGDRNVGNYDTRLIGQKGKVSRRGRVTCHPREKVSVWKLVAKAIASLGHDLRDFTGDDCQRCFGERGGVKGNENVIDGVVLCDYCSADDHLAAQKREARIDHATEFAKKVAGSTDG